MVIKNAWALLAFLALTGCAPSGIIYTNIVSPYTRDFDATPVGTKTCSAKATQLKEPVSGYGVSAVWTNSYILEEAKKAGISKIDYVDKRTLSVLLGIYKRETLIIHGD